MSLFQVRPLFCPNNHHLKGGLTPVQPTYLPNYHRHQHHHPDFNHRFESINLMQNISHIKTSWWRDQQNKYNFCFLDSQFCHFNFPGKPFGGSFYQTCWCSMALIDANITLWTEDLHRPRWHQRSRRPLTSSYRKYLEKEKSVEQIRQNLYVSVQLIEKDEVARWRCLHYIV